MQIKRTELKNKYGIDLPKGKYRILKEGNRYKISTVKDDTQGCILCGENKLVGKIINSTIKTNEVISLIKKADESYITVRNV